jgi:formate dehydrogenase subunit gamma
MTARIAGLLVGLATIALIVLSVYAYGDAVKETVLPTGGVTDRGPQDAVPSDEAANAALAARAQLQGWRGAQGPDPSAAPASPTGADLAGDSTDRAATAVDQPWVNAAPEDSALYRDRAFVSGTTSLPDPKAGVLLQEAGRDWRRLHNVELTVGGGIAVLAVLALLGLFLALRGRVRLQEGFSGDPVERFAAYERINHWMTAVSFVVVALTGLVLLYGQFFLRPIVGAGNYSTLATLNVLLHLGFAVPFICGVALMIGFWIRQNLPTRTDMAWLAKGGGLLFPTKAPVHAYRFNAGQKLIFWLVVLGALLLLASGVSLVFPFFWLGMSGMQWALLLHAGIGLAMVAVILGHIYIGTVGMEGAFSAMWTGDVDRNWAREHHDLWRPQTGGNGTRQQPAE